MKVKIKMEELLKLYGWTLSRMAIELDCSISQISKIKNSQIVITKDFQEKFQEKFPDYVLVNGVESWKEKYQELEKKYNELLATSFALKTKLEQQFDGLKSIHAQLCVLGVEQEEMSKTDSMKLLEGYEIRRKRKARK